MSEAADGARRHGLTSAVPTLGPVLAVIGVAAVGEAVAILAWSRVAAATTLVWWCGAVFVLAGWRSFLALIALLVGLPLVTVEIGFGDVERTLSADKLVLLGVAAAWLVRSWRPFRRHPSPPAARWWLPFLAVIALSALGQASRLEVVGVVKHVVFAVLFLAVLEQLTAQPSLLRPALMAAAMTAGVVALLALVERALAAGGLWVSLYFKQGTMSDPYVIAPIGYARLGGSTMFGATLAHPNFLSAYLVLVSPSLIALAVGTAGRIRTVMLVAAGLVVIALALTSSIGAWVGLIVGVGVLALLVGTRSPTRRTRLALVVTLGLITVTGVVVGLVKFAAGSRAGLTSMNVRVVTHRIGLAALAERPWLGFGEKGFARESLRLEERLYGGRTATLRRSDQGFSAHSSFLQIAVERGLLGLAAFCGLLIAIVGPGLTAALRERDGPTRTLRLGLLAGVIAFIVQAFTENLFDYSKTAALFWIMAAALVSLGPASPERATR